MYAKDYTQMNGATMSKMIKNGKKQNQNAISG
jgi:hypothetical protein